MSLRGEVQQIYLDKMTVAWRPPQIYTVAGSPWTLYTITG